MELQSSTIIAYPYEDIFIFLQIKGLLLGNHGLNFTIVKKYLKIWFNFKFKNLQNDKLIASVKTFKTNFPHTKKKPD